MIRSIDPQLQSGSVQGFNRLTRVAVPTGMVLGALGRQLDDAPALPATREDWEQRFSEAVDRSGEARPAVDFCRQEYLPLASRERPEPGEHLSLEAGAVHLRPAAVAHVLGC